MSRICIVGAVTASIATIALAAGAGASPQRLTGELAVTEYAQGPVWHVVLLRPNGTTRRLPVKDARAVAWSPNGSRLLVAHNPDGTHWPGFGLFVMGLGGSLRGRVLGVGDGGATWSPDGQRIAYDWDVRANGNFISIASTTRKGPRRTLDIGAPSSGMCFLSDGRLVYATGPPRPGLFALDASRSSSRPERIRTAPRALFSSPACSPDGRHVAVDGIAVVDVDSMTFKEFPRRRGFSPEWSPDGSKIAYWGYWRHGSKLLVVDADGANVRLLAAGGRHVNARPTWSPDGSMIAYTNSDDGAAYVVRADGGAPPERALQSSEVDYYMPLWRPTH